MNLPERIKAVQTKVGAVPDGQPGPETWSLIYRVLGLKEPDVDGTKVDARSETAIATLHPKVRPYARALVQQAAEQGITIIVTSALRTYAEQNALYAQGRTKPGKVVTNAKGGFSSHNFATAFDVTIFSGKSPVWDSPKYQAIGSLGKSIGLSWGGSWSKPDEPHFYLVPGWARGLSESQMMAGLRERTERGSDVFA